MAVGVWVPLRRAAKGVWADWVPLGVYPASWLWVWVGASGASSRVVWADHKAAGACLLARSACFAPSVPQFPPGVTPTVCVTAAAAVLMLPQRTS